MSSSGRHSRVLWGPGDGLGAYKVMPEQFAVRHEHRMRTPPPRPPRNTTTPGACRSCPIWALPRLHSAIARTHENAGQLVKHPVLGRIQALEVLLGACKGEQPSSYMGLCAERRRRVTHREPCWMKPLGRKRTSAALADTWRRPHTNHERTVFHAAPSRLVLFASVAQQGTFHDGYAIGLEANNCRTNRMAASHPSYAPQ